jgi:hypothetical protein
MTASIVQSTTESITLQITIPLSQSFLDTEETIQSVLNEAGTLASGEALKGTSKNTKISYRKPA